MLPAASVARNARTWRPGVVKTIATEYVVHAAPSSEYSRRATPEPASVPSTLTASPPAMARLPGGTAEPPRRAVATGGVVSSRNWVTADQADHAPKASATRTRQKYPPSASAGGTQAADPDELAIPLVATIEEKPASDATWSSNASTVSPSASPGCQRSVGPRLTQAISIGDTTVAWGVWSRSRSTRVVAPRFPARSMAQNSRT